MANRRQKKKKSAAASKQAVAQYKGKNAPVKAAPVKKPVEEKPVEKPVDVPVKLEPLKPEVKPQPTKKAEPQKKKASPQKSSAQKAKNAKQKPAKKKISAKPKLSKRIKNYIVKIGINKFAAIVLAVSAVIAAVCIIVWVTSSQFGIPDEAVRKYAGRNISADITLTVKDDLEIQYKLADEMKRKGDTKKFRYYATDKLVFVEKNSVANLGLVNVWDNECVIMASIVDAEGNVIFSSLGLPPGQSLTDIGINPRPYGTYDMKLVVAGYDPETFELIGVQSSDLTVQVGIEEETTDVQQTEK